MLFRSLDLRPARVWTPMERLDEEFKAVGFYLSGHPLDAYESVLRGLNAMSWVEFEQAAQSGVSAARLAGIVVSARERRSQKGNKFAFAMFSDQTGSFEAVIFSDTLDQCGHLLVPGTAVSIAVEADRDGDSIKLRVQGLQALDEAAASLQREVKIILDADVIASNPQRVLDLRALLKTGGKSDVRFVLRLNDRDEEIDIGFAHARFDLTASQRGTMSTMPGVLEIVES